MEQKGEKVNVPDMCKSFQDVAVGLVIDRTLKVIKKYHVKQVILAGGVSANSYLRSEIQEKLKGFDLKITIPPIWCTTDNAAMIAKVAEKLYERKMFASLDLGVDPNWEISDYDKFENIDD